MSAIATLPDPLGIIPTHLTQAVLTSASRALRISDQAFRNNRHLQMMMLYDLTLMMAEGIRRFAVVGLPWTIEAADAANPQHRAEAAAIEAALRKTPRVMQMLNCLGRAPFFGQYGCSVTYDRFDSLVTADVPKDPDMPSEGGSVEASAAIGIRSWVPIHGDSMVYTEDGSLAIRVNRSHKQGDGQYITTENGRALLLSESERLSMVVNVWNIQAPEWLDQFSAQRVYAGEGLRSLLWFAWLRKQHLSQQGTHYAERLARGTVFIRYQQTSEAAKAQAEEIARSMQSDYVTLLPVSPEDPEPLTSPVEIVEPTGQGHQIFVELEDRADTKLMKAVLHQDLMTGTAPTGLGSGVAEAHEQTFRTVVRYDADCMSDALSTDLVRPMHRLNFPESDAELRFVYKYRDDDEEAEAVLARAEKAVQIGMTIAESEVRSRSGFREPQKGEPFIGGVGHDTGVDRFVREIASMESA